MTKDFFFFLLPTEKPNYIKNPPRFPDTPSKTQDTYRYATVQRRFLNKEQCRNLIVGIKSPRPADFASFLVRTYKK